MKSILLLLTFTASLSANAFTLCEIKNHLGGVSAEDAAIGLIGGGGASTLASLIQARAMYEVFLEDEYKKALMQVNWGPTGPSMKESLTFKDSELDKVNARREELRKLQWHGQRLNQAQTFDSMLRREINVLLLEKIRDSAQVAMTNESVSEARRNAAKIQFEQATDELKRYKSTAHMDEVLKKMGTKYNMAEVRQAAAATIRARRAANIEYDYTRTLRPEARAERLARGIVYGDIELSDSWKKVIDDAHVKLGYDRGFWAKIPANVKSKTRGKVSALGAMGAGLGAIGYAAYRQYTKPEEQQTMEIAALTAKIEQDCGNQKASGKADEYLNEMPGPNTKTEK